MLDLTVYPRAAVLMALAQQSLGKAREETLIDAFGEFEACDPAQRSLMMPIDDGSRSRPSRFLTLRLVYTIVCPRFGHSSPAIFEKPAILSEILRVSTNQSPREAFVLRG